MIRNLIWKLKVLFYRLQGVHLTKETIHLADLPEQFDAKPFIDEWKNKISSIGIEVSDDEIE